MCIIIDANRANECFGSRVSTDARPVIKWVTSGYGKIVFGGKLYRELLNTKFRTWLLGQYRIGLAHRLPDAAVDEKAEELSESNLLVSDDPHVIAVALVSGTRLLYSHDDDLINDFKNNSIINNPRGKVYKTQRNKQLLHRHICRLSNLY